MTASELERAATRPGWPRPYADYHDPISGETKRLPVPYVTGTAAVKGEWGRIETQAEYAYQSRCCAVCGETIEGAVWLGIGDAEDALDQRTTSGPGCCSRCMIVAIRTCPHLQDVLGEAGPDGLIGWRHEGPGCGVDHPAWSRLYECQVDPLAEPFTYNELRQAARTPNPS